MRYNWEEIFKTTSSEDLYRIYKGYSLKPKEAIPFAKKELERRGFDFNDMDNNKKRWQLINALEDKELEHIGTQTRETFYIPFKYLPLVLAGLGLLVYFIIREENKPFDWNEFWFLMGFFTILILVNNTISMYRYKTRKRLQNKIDRLKKELHCNNIAEPEECFQDKNVFQQDVKRKKKELETLSLIMGIITLIALTALMFAKIYKITK